MKRVLLAALVLVASQDVRTQTASIRFVMPAATSYVTGAVTLEVAFKDMAPSDVESVTFFADGQQICVAPPTRPDCRWDAGLQLKSHAFRAVARLKTGERLVANVRTIAPEYVESVSVDVILANAVVSDAGRFVTGLPREAFRVLDDGEERRITSFQSTDAPLEIVLALDVSDSMRNVLPDVKKAAIGMVRALRPRDRVTLVVFNDTMFVPVRGSVSPDEVTQAIDNLTTFGGTALYDVVVRSLELVSRQAGKHAVVIFSDGDDRSSQVLLADVQRAVGTSDAMIFAVGLGSRADRQVVQDRLEAITGTSGGRVLVADRSGDLEASFADIVRDVVNQYTLGFEPRRDGRTHRIKIELVGRGGRVRARQSYLAPAARP